MKLIQARIRGLGKLKESQWFELSPHLNLFQFPDHRGLNDQTFATNFLQLLQTINPTYDIETIQPFANFPHFTKQGGYTRHINPAKRTVALAVFSATPSLVKELAVADEWLYETDRIEVGRRLDYSRWINFVEIAASTRWSEICDNMQILLDQVQDLTPDLTIPIADILHSLKPADRIKNELQEKLAHWLENLPASVQKNSDQLIESTISSVMRADHFQIARDIVCSRLPLFVTLGNSISHPNTKKEATNSLHNLLHLIANSAKSPGKDSITDEHTFYDKLNEQLERSNFSSMTLRIQLCPTGLLLMIDDKPMQTAPGDPVSSLLQIQAKAFLAVAFSRVAYKTEPVLLFAEPERELPSTLHNELADFVINISNTCQCLYSFSNVDIFSNKKEGKRYSLDDLHIPELL